MRILFATLLSLTAASFVHLVSTRAEAHEYSAGSLTIEHPTISPPPAGRTTTAGYVTLVNESDAPDRLLSVSSPAAERIEMHETRAGEGGMVSMAAIQGGVAIPAHGQVAFATGGLHLMVIGLRRPLAQGDALPLTLTFERAGAIEITAAVERPHTRDAVQHSGHAH